MIKNKLRQIKNLPNADATFLKYSVMTINKIAINAKIQTLSDYLYLCDSFVILYLSVINY